MQRCYPATRIVYMTGYAEEAFDNSVDLDERTYIILKPFKKSDLARTVRAALDDPAGRA